MQPHTAKKDRRVIDLNEYRKAKTNRATAAEETGERTEDEVLTKVSYYLLMAARTIAGQKGKH